MMKNLFYIVLSRLLCRWMYYAAFMCSVVLHLLYEAIQGHPWNFSKFINIYERQYYMYDLYCDGIMLSVQQTDAIVRKNIILSSQKAKKKGTFVFYN